MQLLNCGSKEVQQICKKIYSGLHIKMQLVNGTKCIIQNTGQMNVVAQDGNMSQKKFCMHV